MAGNAPGAAAHGPVESGLGVWSEPVAESGLVEHGLGAGNGHEVGNELGAEGDFVAGSEHGPEAGNGPEVGSVPVAVSGPVAVSVPEVGSEPEVGSGPAAVAAGAD